MPRTYKKHHHTYHKRRHHRHTIQRPLVATKHYVRVTARQVLAIIPPAADVGAWEQTIAVAWQQPNGIQGANYFGFDFANSEFLS